MFYNNLQYNSIYIFVVLGGGVTAIYLCIPTILVVKNSLQLGAG